MPFSSRSVLFLSWTCTVLLAGAQCLLAGRSFDAKDLTELSLEELLRVEVTTVSRRPEQLSRASAAVHVITRDDIRRSGATNLPEVLRLAPGLQVARVHAHQWAVSARGFNDVFANKLLVMIDGRSIYTPLFSGVFWDMHHTMLEDIERIEVIRGPGAPLWGANAVNGIINIITKEARDTQGTLVSVASGNYEPFIGSIRHGARLGESSFLRVYFNHHRHDAFPAPGGGDAEDAWERAQGGFRADWHTSGISKLTLQGDLYHGLLDEAFLRPLPDPPYMILQPDTIRTRGGNLLARFSRSPESEADVTLQAYYDRAIRDTAIFRDDRHTADFDFQHRPPSSDRHRVTWGGNYRLHWDEVENTFDVSLDPSRKTLQLFSLFLQDDIEVWADRLIVTLGSKIEHNDFTGFEIQPGARLSFKPRERHTLWAAVSRAVRTPSRAERGVRINGPPVIPVDPADPNSPGRVTSFFGSPTYRSEELIAYEAGYRVQPLDTLSFDVALFFNDYDNLRSLEPTVPDTSAHTSFFSANELRGESYGLEVASTWHPTRTWRIHGSYSLLRMHLRRAPGSQDPLTVEEVEGSSPRHQWLLRSSVDLAREWEWDTWFHFVDELPAREIDSYLEMNMRLAWRPWNDFEVSLVGRNLLNSRHEEFTPSFIQNRRAEIPRTFYGQLAWNF
jgi:iron complex outermembrane recepter protein